MITQAIISAGGAGTRLRPITETIPKPMIPILGKPLLEWNIEQFKRHGVIEFFLPLYYLPTVVMDYFGDGSQFGVTIHYSVEKDPLGSAGGIKTFEEKLNTTFYYIYGDVFSLIDYSKMAAAYFQKDTPIGMERMQQTNEYTDANVAELNGEGRVVRVHSKPHSETHPNAYRMRGSFILDKKVLSYIPNATFFDLGKELVPALIEAGENFYAYECDEYSKGIDTVEKLEEVVAHLQEANIA